MMLGWMIVFLGVGFVIGTLVMLSCINDHVAAYTASSTLLTR